jgi:hypothetical protein
MRKEIGDTSVNASMDRTFIHPKTGEPTTMDTSAIGKRATELVKRQAVPNKSDRAIADELGISHQTVGRARQELTGPSGPVDERIGQDGKSYSVRQRVTMLKRPFQ